jgi:hypothetical protein
MPKLLEPNARYQGRGTRWDRLGKLVGVVPHSAGEHPSPLRASIGLSGASPPYGVVKLPSVF